MLKQWFTEGFFLCVLVPGCLIHSVTDMQVSLVGASGGVYAILGAHVAAIVIVSFFLFVCLFVFFVNQRTFCCDLYFIDVAVKYLKFILFTARLFDESEGNKFPVFNQT